MEITVEKDNPRLKIIESVVKNSGLLERKNLYACLTNVTQKTSSGFPSISPEAFDHFLKTEPHLFRPGAELVEWLTKLGQAVADSPIDDQERVHLERSIRVIRNVVYTAAVTSPPDLWVLRHVLSVYRRLGITADLQKGKIIGTEQYCQERSISQSHFKVELEFLYSRGFLERLTSGYRKKDTPQINEILSNIIPLPDQFPQDMILPTVKMLQGKTSASITSLCNSFYQLDCEPKLYPGWLPSYFDIEAGYRLMPLVLAVRVMDASKMLKVGVKLSEILPEAPEHIHKFLCQLGLINSEGIVGLLGARVFSRGPGPFGIIHAYHSYMFHLDQLIIGQRPDFWVARGENVAASQDANAKTFKLANDALDRFCQDTGFQYDVFIEHAVGQGEATRQRFELSGDKTIRYFGADLEQAAIQKATLAQEAGLLPEKMEFISNADIGQPQVLVDAFDRAKTPTQGAVMIVGNGFHEVREQTNEKMVEVFRQYCKAGILIIFTEESGLSDDDLLETGWNTYHAGFRFVHELSGQGLRPAIDNDDAERYSWDRCATEAGYVVVEQYTSRTRTIFPHPKPDGRNPAISVNYFCVPKAIWNQLNKT